MTRPDISIVFRALNEAKWFGQALEACKSQDLGDLTAEIILVDSGSTDGTLEIARSHNVRIVEIPKSRFTFGRSLNWGCEAAEGKYLVFISAHCIPAHDKWLWNLVEPIRAGICEYSYGRQIGHECTHFSENQIFAKYFPEYDKLPQGDYFINNANSAIPRETWEKYRFDEDCTGLEDMVLGKAIFEDGGKMGYVADAPVIHIHEETLRQTYRRYYREALTLRDIMPDVQVRLLDVPRYVLAATFHDYSEALKERTFFRNCLPIIAFRSMQFWGSYRGHQERSRISDAQKEAYYYPRVARRRGEKRDQSKADVAIEKGK